MSFNEKNNWLSINPPAQRFIKYAIFNNWGKRQKLRLNDVIDSELNEKQYNQLIIDLALEGYMLNLIEGYSKYKIMMGEGSKRLFSYYELIPSKLRKEVDMLRLRIIEASNMNRSNGSEKAINEKIVKINKVRLGAKPLRYEIANKIFDLYLNGLSLSKIINYLEEHSIIQEKGKQWHRSSINYVLHNHIYVDNGCITEEDFQKAQHMLDMNRKNRKFSE